MLPWRPGDRCSTWSRPMGCLSLACTCTSLASRILSDREAATPCCLNLGTRRSDPRALRRLPKSCLTPCFPAGRRRHRARLCPQSRGPPAIGSDSMPLYECVLIARNDVTQQQVEGIADGIAGQLETEGGEVKKREYWGLRSLAYRIKKNRKGHYMLLGLDAKPTFVTEMERQLGLNEDILRFMTLRVDEIEEAPSAVLTRKSDDRERSFRGPKPAGRFDSGRRRGFDDREEYRARDEFRPDDMRVDAEE